MIMSEPEGMCVNAQHKITTTRRIFFDILENIGDRVMM